MSRFVLDCSLTMTWCFQDESDARSLRVFHSLESATAIVPRVLWDLEVWNALFNALRRKRIQSIEKNMAIIAALPVVRRSAPLNAVPALALRHGLTSYDAAYLALALREKLPLATMDNALIRAATEENVKLYDVTPDA